MNPLTLLSVPCHGAASRRWLSIPLWPCLFSVAGLFLLARAAEPTVDELIPKLAADRFEDRYEPQMQLQRLVAHASRPGAEAERAELARQLAAKAADASVPQAARVWLVRQLEHAGAAESVEALAGLLAEADAELRECARRALEKNPARAATAELRAALKRGGDPAWRAGLVHSLGERGDAEAVELIALELAQPDLAPVAGAALGKIATPAAVKLLWSAWDKKTPGAADSLVSAASSLVAKEDLASAGAIYQKLYAAGGPAPVHAACLVGWVGLVKTDPGKARTLLKEALGSSSPQLQQAAVTAAQVAYGQTVTSVLTPLLLGLEPPAQALVLPALDGSAEKEVIALAESKVAASRPAALESLGRIGGPASVPVLVKAAASDLGAEKAAATAALARVSGAGVDPVLEKLAAGGDAKQRAAAIQALAARGQTGCLPDLEKYAAGPDATVSQAAYAAVARMGTDQQIGWLARQALRSSQTDARNALKAVAGRVRDPAAASRTILAAGPPANPEQWAGLFEVLSILGGPEALAVVQKQTASADENLRDVALRALGDWPDFAAAEPLLALASDANLKLAHHALAIQGIVRLVKTLDNQPPARRVDAALAALRAARRDEERRLALSALGVVPDAKAVEALRPLLGDASLKNDAGATALTLAEALRRGQRPLARQLAQAVRDANISEALNQRAEALLNR